MGRTNGALGARFLDAICDINICDAVVILPLPSVPLSSIDIGQNSLSASDVCVCVHCSVFTVYANTTQQNTHRTSECVLGVGGLVAAITSGLHLDPHPARSPVCLCFSVV